MMRAVQVKNFELRLIGKYTTLVEIFERHHNMSELVLGVSCNKLVPVCSKVSQLTVDENIMHAQLGLKEIFCVSIVTGGV